MPWISKEQKSALVNYYLYFLKRLDEVLVKGKYKYLVIDTIEQIEAGMAAWAESNRSASGWSGQRDHGKFENEAVRPLYDAMLESFAQRGIECVLMTSHLKDKWMDDKPVPGKITPGGRLTLLSRLSSIMFWMVGNVGNASGAPAAIVMKARRAQVDVVDDEWVIKKPLPQRIKDFSWAEVRRYEREGCDHANPKDGEMMTPDEMDMISEFLNKEQMRLMVLGAEMDLETAKAQAMPFIGNNGNGTEGWSGVKVERDPEIVAQVMALAAEGLKPIQIMGKVTGVTIQGCPGDIEGGRGVRCPSCGNTGFKWLTSSCGIGLKCVSCGREGPIDDFGCVECGCKVEPVTEPVVEEPISDKVAKEMSVGFALARVNAGCGGTVEASCLQQALQDYDERVKWATECELRLTEELAEAQYVARKMYQDNKDIFSAFGRRVPEWVLWLDGKQPVEVKIETLAEAKMLVDQGHPRTEFIQRGAYSLTWVTLKVNGEVLVGYGFAKCNPSDVYEPKLGRRISLGRARKDLARQIYEGSRGQAEA